MVGSVAYRLDLPLTSWIHPNFYVSQLKRKIDTNILAIPTLPPIGGHNLLHLEIVEMLSRCMPNERS